MSEFKLQHLVAELLDCLGGTQTPESLVEVLQNSITSDVNPSCPVWQTSSQSHIQKIVETSKTSDLFVDKYEDLKQKNVYCLNSYVQLLSQISQDSGVKSLLRRSTKRTDSATSSSTNHTDIAQEDLASVRNRIKKAVSRDLRKDRHQSYPSTLSVNLNATTVPLATTPSMASWVQRRPTMSCDFSSSNISCLSAVIPVISQESALIDDLLNVLIGLPGRYIEPNPLKDMHDNRTFTINDSVPLPLRELVKQVLPIASHYSVIQRFAEEKMRFEFGQVNNALAEAMDLLIKEHLIYVTQLETDFQAGNLNLQKLWFHMLKRQPAMEITATIASTISKSDASGGKVLSLLHENIIGTIGDEKTNLRCIDLMEAACVPYMKMLGMWIYRGIISDPINEFLVEDNEVIQKEDMPVDYSADYWEKKYAVRRERIPTFLEPVADYILKAGKYLNVIRQCGKPVLTKIKAVQYKIEGKTYITAIEEAYRSASQTLLDLVLRENDLIGRLRSVKHYFLLDQGDFIVAFLTLCEKELNRDVTDVIPARIESLMELALRISSATNDPYKDDLRAELLPYDLPFQMFKILTIQTSAETEYRANSETKRLLMIESFSFGYEVRWPLSLVLNRKSLACYQMIMRHLFYCKYVERLVCQVWKANKVAKHFQYKIAQHYRSAFALRQRMLHCVQNLEYYMMVEVIEPHWCTFLQNITKVNNVDEILACHSDFVDNCLEDCMLTIPEVLSTIIKLLAICVDFCRFMQRNQRYFIEAELGSLPNSMFESLNQNDIAFKTNSIQSKSTNENNTSFNDQIALLDVEFSAALMQLLDQINNLNRDSSERDRLFNLIYRLDFNSFYTTKVERMGLNRINGGFS